MRAMSTVGEWAGDQSATLADRVPGREPVVVGWKVTMIVQEELPARELPQFEVAE